MRRLPKVDYFVVYANDHETEACFFDEESGRLLRRSRHGGFILDRNMHILVCNRLFVDFIGFSPDEIIDVNVDHFVRADYHKRIKKNNACRQLGVRVPAIYGIVYVAKDGTEKPVESEIYTFTTKGEIRTVVGIQRILKA